MPVPESLGERSYGIHVGEVEPVDLCTWDIGEYLFRRIGPPSRDDGFDTWLTRTLLDPGRAVYSRTETEHLMREDPRIGS